jgi:hypothetical protein
VLELHVFLDGGSIWLILWIVLTILDKIWLDIVIVNIWFEYLIRIRYRIFNIWTLIRADLNPSKWIRSRIWPENIRTVFTLTYLHAMQPYLSSELSTSHQGCLMQQSLCSAALISTAYQPWYSVFLSQQNSHSRLISRRNILPNEMNAIRYCITVDEYDGGGWRENYMKYRVHCCMRFLSTREDPSILHPAVERRRLNKILRYTPSVLHPCKTVLN